VKAGFSAAHHLPGYPGDCARPHGHNYELEVFARSKKLDPVGMAVDFRLLKGAVRELIAPWDHRDLNQLEDFRQITTSAEQIAKLAHDRLSAVLNGPELKLDRVTVWEGEGCSATYWADERI
jgi:6-pyruvoyltetrahydropterin/6-carboxytetrahydropterin synthase